MKEDKATQRADARRNYDRLLSAARTVFLSEGAAASLDVIAKKAGVGIGTLYRHFPTRLELLWAVYGERIDDLIREVSAHSEKITPDEALSQWLGSIVRFSKKHHAFRDLVVNASVNIESSLGIVSAQLLREAQVKGYVRQDVTVEGILRLVQGVALHDTSETEAAKLLEIIFDGLRTKNA